MTWFIIGCGEYILQPPMGTPGPFPPSNRAVDVYLDEWVQIRLFSIWELLSDEIPAHQNRPFRMIQPTSRRSERVGSHCEI